MRMHLLNKDYKKDENFYKAYINNESMENFLSSEYIDFDDSLCKLDLDIYVGDMRGADKDDIFIKLVRTVGENFISLDKEIYMSELFWHSYFTLVQNKNLLDKYPQVKESKKTFDNIILKDFDWECYTYKAVMLACLVKGRYNNLSSTEYMDKLTYYSKIATQNFDMFNYMLKSNLLRTANFVLNILDIVNEEGLGPRLKKKVIFDNVPDKDLRLGRLTLIDINKLYPNILVTTLNKEELRDLLLDILKQDKYN